MKTTIKLAKHTLTITTGTDGPRHDPYHYEAWSWQYADGTKIEYRESGLLDDTVTINGVEVFQRDCSVQHFQKFVKELTGHSMTEWRRAVERLSARRQSVCTKCGGHRTGEWSDGYPGESFLICSKCGHHMSYQFTESAII